MEVFFEVKEDEIDGGYTARAIGESIFTEADTVEELREAIKDAVHCHFEEGEAPKARTETGKGCQA